LKIIAPWREWDIRSRDDAIDYAEARGISIPVTKERPYSMDRNLWHLSHEGGDLEDPWNEPKDDVYMLTVPPEKAPDKPVYLELEFEKGIPTKIDGKAFGPVELIEKLNELAGQNGVGIVDMVENRLVGMKSRGIYETPGGTVLMQAHKELELLTLDRDTLHFKEIIAVKYAELVYDGMWFCQLREALDEFVDKTQETVSGTVRMKLYKGNCTPAGTKSPYSLYNEELATFGEDEIYSQKDAEGFINLFGLPLKVRALMKRDIGR
ncbi:MAG TPA: argininosuccinate synthase, partial [Clostridia bacterium]|nr:argininosuccinate synthase [Clostridia bacterium]